jgi:hypothetical protein
MTSGFSSGDLIGEGLFSLFFRELQPHLIVAVTSIISLLRVDELIHSSILAEIFVSTASHTFQIAFD